MNNKFISQIGAQIFSNPYTSTLMVIGVVGLLVYSKTMTPAQLAQHIFTLLVAGSAADGNKTKELQVQIDDLKEEL